MQRSNSFLEGLMKLYQLHQVLKSKGFKNKDLAKAIGLKPSAYSSLFKKIIYPIIEEDNSSNQHALSERFKQVNNVSEIKTRRSLDQYLDILTELHSASSNLPNIDYSFLEKYFNNKVNRKQADRITGNFYLGFELPDKAQFKYPIQIKHEAIKSRMIIFHTSDIALNHPIGFGYYSEPSVLSLYIEQLPNAKLNHLVAHLSIWHGHEFDVRGHGIYVNMDGASTTAKIELSKFQESTQLTFIHNQYEK